MIDQHGTRTRFASNGGLFFLHILIFTSIQTLAAQSTDLQISVMDSQTQTALPLVFLELKGPDGSKKLEKSGKFSLKNLEAGHYSIAVEAAGYQSATVEFEYGPGSEPITIDLQPTQQLLEHMVVSPSHYSFIRETGETVHSVTREEIQNSPRFGDDLFRALSNLPGTSSGDYSASFGVRGGEYRELVVTMDGMELHDPFHLKDFSGVFSIIDPETIGGLDLITGGYGAQHGNALSGVMEMSTLQPTSTKSTAGLSFSNASFRTQGVFAHGLGSYLFSGRRGYLDILLDLTGGGADEDEELSINYWDSFGKIGYVIHPQHNISFDFLLAGDELKLRFDDEDEKVNADTNYDNTYLWANWRSVWLANLSSETIVYYSDFKDRRDAESADNDSAFLVDDTRSYQHLGIKQDWALDIDNSHYITWGWDAKNVTSDYQYRSTAQHDILVLGAQPSVARNEQLDPDGHELSAYMSDRVRVGSSLVMDLGLRYDSQSLTDENQVSPRLNAAYTTKQGHVWRAAWGEYHQASRIQELQIEDGVNSFQNAERSTHSLLGYEHAFSGRTNVRIEAFHKALRDLRPRYENLFQALEAFPELSDDRYLVNAERAEVAGVDLVVRQEFDNWGWIANYTHSKAEDEIDGAKVLRSWDQKHAANLSFNYQWTQRLHLNVSWRYHTGWRTTPVVGVEHAPAGSSSEFLLITGPINSEAFPAYHRIDLRLVKRAKATKRGGFEWYLDVHNLLNRENIKGYDYEVYEDINGELIVDRDTSDFLPILPTFGMTWTF